MGFLKDLQVSPSQRTGLPGARKTRRVSGPPQLFCKSPRWRHTHRPFKVRVWIPRPCALPTLLLRLVRSVELTVPDSFREVGQAYARQLQAGWAGRPPPSAEASRAPGLERVPHCCAAGAAPCLQRRGLAPKMPASPLRAHTCEQTRVWPVLHLGGQSCSS